MALLHNAQQLKIALTDVSAIALSHGHYDHTGSLPALLTACPTAALFLHPAAIQPKYSARRSVGAPIASPQALQTGQRRVIWTETPTAIVPGVYLTGPVPRQHPLEDTGETFWCDPDRQVVDPLLDDQALFLDGPDGWVVVLGCAHAGVINTLDYIAKLTGATQFRAVLGGMHLLYASPERIQATIATLEHYQVQTVAANHCTGRQALITMATVLGDRCCDGRVGTCWQFSNVT